VTGVLDNNALELYKGALRGSVAFPLYASLIRDPRHAAQALRSSRSAACPPDGMGSGASK